MVQKISEQLAEHVYRGGFIHCRDIHKDECLLNALKKFVSVFRAATKFYTPLHIVPVLLFKRRKLFQDPKSQSWFLLKNIVNSCLFIAVYVATFQYMLCFTKNTRGKVDRWNVILATLVCGFALVFEHKSRRNELVMYMLPRMMESIYRLLMERGLVKAYKFGEVFIFALCMALIMFCYQTKPEQIKPAYLDMLKRFFGTN